MSNVLAIIPARGGSKRLPGKNLRPFLERPLIQWSVDFALGSRLFDRVVASTDSVEIAASCEAVGLTVPALRPADLATDTASSVDVALHALIVAEADGAKFDIIALLQPTSPIRLEHRWSRAIDLIKTGTCDAVIGVAPVRDHPFHVFRLASDNDLHSWSVDQQTGLRTQDLPPAVVVNGNLYLVRTETLREYRTFIPARTKGSLCDVAAESIDIDTETDFIVGEALARDFMTRRTQGRE